MPDPTAPCPVCRSNVPTIDGNLILHRHRDQLGPCPAGQVPDPGVDEEWSDHHDGVGDCTSCGRNTTLRSDPGHERWCRSCWETDLFGDDDD